jgi:membrane protein DedA with SNARE-associated domain
MSIVPVILFATLGSILGATFFYYDRRARWARAGRTPSSTGCRCGDRGRRHALRWFERHGRSAVFFGRMVPIVRSFISVPAGVVRMPFLQFLVYTAAAA